MIISLISDLKADFLITVSHGDADFSGESMNLESCYEPHWMNIRWVQIEPLNEALELRNSEKGIEERAKLFGKGLPELKALILGDFGVFKPKTIIRIGFCHGHYLFMKDNTNRLLMATLEDEMDQNMNERLQYFRDVLFVEWGILLAALLWNLYTSEAECRLYPKSS